MQNYIGVKVIKAEPENRDGRLGYKVEYPGGYQSWSPKEAFEDAYLPMGNNPSLIDTCMVDGFINEITSSQLDEKTTLVKCKTLTGFTQYEVSSCVDPINFDMQIGTDICKKRIRNTLWQCLGFVLQWGRFGLKVK